VKRKEKLQIHLKNLEEALRRNHDELAQLTIQMKKEERDVERLKTLNLTTIFQIILGNKEEQLEKERQEYLHVLLKMQGVEENLKSLEDEKRVLERSYSGLYNVEETFKKLLAEKEKAIKGDAVYTEAVDDFNEKIAVFDAKIEEVQIAIKKGRMSLDRLNDIVLELSDIHRWENGSQKERSKSKTKNNRARRKIYAANDSLQKYVEELHDMSDHLGIDYSLEIKIFERFLDQFIDCLITDWIIKKQIVHSKNFIINVMDRVRLVNSMLQHEVDKTQVYLDEEMSLKADVLIQLIQGKS